MQTYTYVFYKDDTAATAVRYYRGRGVNPTHLYACTLFLFGELDSLY